jgi:SIR2-like domain
MVSIPDELRSLYHEGRVLPFIGAGVSMSVQWKDDKGATRRGPSWAELIGEACKQVNITPHLLSVRGNDLQILEYLKIKKGSLDFIATWLAKSMEPPDDSLKASEIHTELARLDKVDLVYTTNFDDFIERAYVLHGRQVVSVAVENDMMASRAGKVEVIKFHGDLKHTESMVLSEENFAERLRLEHKLDFRLRSDMLGRAILFLGYSFSDPNVSYLFHLAKKNLAKLPQSTSGWRAYIAIPDPSEFERRLFGSRNIDVIPIRGDAMTSQIADLLRRLRS